MILGTVWHKFRMMRSFLAFRLEEVPRIMWLIGVIADGARGHVHVHLLLQSAAKLWFFWNESSWCGDRLELQC